MKATNDLIMRHVVIAIVSLLAAMFLLSETSQSSYVLASERGLGETSSDRFLVPPLGSAPSSGDPSQKGINGGTWSPLGSGADLDVDAIAVSGSNVYVGGAFSHAGGLLVNKVARWDGSAWHALGTGMNNTVSAISLMGSDVYAAGPFTFADGSSANRVARWDGSAWHPLGSGLNSTVFSMAISGSDVYVGGQFTTAGGAAANFIARWDGSAWHPLGSGTNGFVYAIAISGSEVYVGGQFSMAGGVAARNIAKWDGSSWSALGTGSGPDAPVDAIAISGSNVYVGGVFTTVSGLLVNRIARWGGSAWHALGSGLGHTAYAIAINGPDVYVGGRFVTAGGLPASRVAGWNGSDWFDLAGGVNDATNSALVYAMAIGSNGVYAGGTFTIAGGAPATRIALYQTTGLPTITPGPTLTPTHTPSMTPTRTPTRTVTPGPTLTPTRTFTPVAGNHSPILDVPLSRPYRIGVEVSNYLALRFDATDPDAGDIVSLSAQLVPNGASFPVPNPGNPVHTTFTWRPTATDIGTYYMVVTATDSHGAQDSASIQIDVVPGCVPYFSDVFTTDYFYPGVQYLFCHLVVSGYLESDLTSTYRPYNNTTRGQFSKMVALAYDLPLYNPPSPNFADVPAGHTFYSYVEAAFHAGIINGYQCGGQGEPCDPQNHPYFRPGNTITRGQICKLVVLAAAWPIDTTGGPHFIDVSPGHTFYDVIETAFLHTVIVGYQCGGQGEPCDPQNHPYFRPGNATTRGQIAKILWQALGSP